MSSNAYIHREHAPAGPRPIPLWRRPATALLGALLLAYAVTGCALYVLVSLIV